MFNDPDKLKSKRPALNHMEQRKVTSHTQRPEGDWVRHTLMLEGYEVPFVFKRKQAYKSLVGARVNLSYYPCPISVAGIEMEQMKVVRLRRS